MNRRELTMRVISALDEVITNDAMSQYELADSVIERLLAHYDIKERDEQAAAQHDHGAIGDDASLPETLATLRRLLAGNGAAWLDDYLGLRIGGLPFAEAVYAAHLRRSPGDYPAVAAQGPPQGGAASESEPLSLHYCPYCPDLAPFRSRKDLAAHIETHNRGDWR